MIDVQHLSAGELAALLHFFGDAGVDTLLEDEGVDRFAEFAADRPAVAVQGAIPASRSAVSAAVQNRVGSSPPPTRSTTPAPLTVPGEEAVKLARQAAAAAHSIVDLYDAIASFEGCNLKSSARNTVFPKMAGSTPILIFGPAPSADDDREGQAFSGGHGDLLARMLAAINIPLADTTLAHAIAWRPPGGRQPTPLEAEICRPFAERLLQLAKPNLVILMGNFTARFFTGSQDSIHALRGRWVTLTVGGQTFEALPMLHPQDLISAPASKRLAWNDLLDFETKFRS
jgi:uracil-DNA glycosylase